MRLLFVLAVLFVPAILRGAGPITYQMVQGHDACHEIRFPKWTPPFKAIQAPGERAVATNFGCYYEVHTSGDNDLYFTIACPQGGLWRVEEKYIIDTQHPARAAKRVADFLWDSAYALQRVAKPVHPLETDAGVSYRGQIFAYSAPGGTGVGQPRLPAFPSPAGTRIAVNSWSGKDIGTEYWRAVHGNYWIDIYETNSGRSLIRIKGTFKNWSPLNFQAAAAWYTDQYYVIPMEVEGPLGLLSRESGMRRALVCDVDAAARTSFNGK